jgi:hydrogenase maturation factor
VTNNKLVVSYVPLTGKKHIKFGKTIKKEINWDKEILPEVKVGNWVSFHWKYAMQVLNEENVINLYKYTQKTLDSLYGKK